MAKRQIVNVDDLPSNSKASRAPVAVRARDEQDENPRRIVRRQATQAIRKRKTFTQTIAETLVGGSDNAMTYIINDVLIPAAKKTISEMVTSGIEMLLFGETGKLDRGREREGKSYVSYNKRYRGREEERVRPSYRDKFDLDEIFFRNGGDAADVLSELGDIIQEYGQVSVAEFFKLANIESSSWTHTKWGWDDLSDARCTHTRNGYLIQFPKPIELED